jgi:hypothetical protein
VLPPSRIAGYAETRAVVVVEARPFLFATEPTVMIVFGILLCMAGVVALCWLMFNLTVFALPFFAAVTAGMAAMHSGVGPLGAVVVGLIVGIGTLTLGQLAIALVPSSLLRAMIALVFAGPAAFAGYHATHGLAALSMPSEAWRQVFAVVGAVVVGLTALGRMMVPLIPVERRRESGGIIAPE